MTLSEVIHQAPGWLNGAQDQQGMVISCRARLARNLETAPFPSRATAVERDKVIEQVCGAARYSRRLQAAIFLPIESLDNTTRQALVERHLISPALADSQGQRAVLFERDESLGVMINEEDHLRLQAMAPGLQAEEAWRQVGALDDELGAGLNYAHSPRWGYLTACPTNTGTGLRISLLIHLPALVLAEQMERVLRGLTQLSFTVRGFYGEGTQAVGNLFQVSNQVTLGLSEEAIVEGLVEVTGQLIGFERDAQEMLMTEAAAQVEDKAWRAFGLLSNARVLSSQEFMNLLSAVRLGCSLGLIKELNSGFMNQLMIVTQPFHLQSEAGSGELTPEERDIRRAALVRQRIAALPKDGPIGNPDGSEAA